MMKKTKNIGAILLASATLLGTAACGGGSEKEDPTKTYLDVGVFNAGLGTAYFADPEKSVVTKAKFWHFRSALALLLVPNAAPVAVPAASPIALSVFLRGNVEEVQIKASYEI